MLYWQHLIGPLFVRWVCGQSMVKWKALDSELSHITGLLGLAKLSSFRKPKICKSVVDHLFSVKAGLCTQTLVCFFMQLYTTGTAGGWWPIGGWWASLRTWRARGKEEEKGKEGKERKRAGNWWHWQPWPWNCRSKSVTSCFGSEAPAALNFTCKWTLPWGFGIQGLNT